MHGIAEAVGEDLRLDMLGVDDAFLQEHFGVAKGLGRLGDHPRVRLLQFLAVVAAANDPPAGAGGGLEHHRVAEALGLM
ncbi:hypothetical protein D3C77_738230 [compost metagenome]